MDLKKYAVVETSVLALLGPDDVPLMGEDGQPLTVTVYGPGSRPYARAQAAQQNRLLDKLKRKGRADQTAEEKVREQSAYLAACTKEFSGNITYGDSALTGEELHKAIYADNTIGFIAEQVAKHIGEWGNFTPGLPKS